MTRQVRSAVLTATACAVLLTACGSESGKAANSPSASASPSSSASATPTPTSTPTPSPSPSPTDDATELADLLPTTRQMEYLLGYPVELETREDLTQFHEGATVEATEGRVGFYRPPGSAENATAGGYIALSRFTSDAEAARFLDANPNYDEDREVERAKGFLEVFDLSEVSDEGTGYVYREAGEPPTEPPTEHTQGVARIGDVVIEVTLFHQPGLNLIAQTRQVVDDFRARLPQNPAHIPAQTGTQTPTAGPE